MTREIRPPAYAQGKEPTLSFEDLCAALITYQRTLFEPAGITIVWGGELWLWAWITQLLIAPPLIADDGSYTQRLLPRDDYENAVTYLLKLTCRTALADIPTRDIASKEEWMAEMQRKRMTEWNAQEMIREKNGVLAYLSFPLLEGITKLRCPGWVTLDGEPLQRWVSPKGGRPYDPTDTRPRKYSNVRDLLWLLHQQVGDADERAGLDAFRAQLRSAVPTTDPYQLVFDWRNAALHGADLLTRVGHTVYNLALLIGLYAIRARFDAIRAEAADLLEQIRKRDATMGPPATESPFYFYPPHAGPPTKNVVHGIQSSEA